MTDLDITLAPERLQDGTPEECAAFGLFSMHAGKVSLTEGYDDYAASLRAGPLVSGYHVAEWFAWNWWRIRYEPDASASRPEWWRAHRLTAIGQGYVWPNLTFRTDGVRAVIRSDPSSNPQAKPFRFIGAQSWLGSARDLGQAIDTFIARILARLRERGVGPTNLDTIWSEVLTERSDPNLAERRRLEALLGRDPNEIDDDAVERLLADRPFLGADPIAELAADATGAAPVSGAELRDLAVRAGIETRQGDAVLLTTPFIDEARRQEQAWEQGRSAAEALRRQYGIDAGPVLTRSLMELLGASATAQPRGASTPLSYLLRSDGQAGRIVLRSKRVTGQRFELARLLGDHMLFGTDPLLPATSAYTFRQAAQRSFAAEFLIPVEELDEKMHGDTSPEAIDDAAEHFPVSSVAIDRVMQNKSRRERKSMQNAA